jgi:hypothetical protein
MPISVGICRVVASTGSTETSDFDPSRTSQTQLFWGESASPVWRSKPAADASFRSRARSSDLQHRLLPISVGTGDDEGGGMVAAEVSNLFVSRSGVCSWFPFRGGSGSPVWHSQTAATADHEAASVLGT